MKAAYFHLIALLSLSLSAAYTEEYAQPQQVVMVFEDVDHRIIHSPMAMYAMAVYTVYKMRDTRFAEREARYSMKMNGIVAAVTNPKSPNVDVLEHDVTALAGHQKDEKDLSSLEDKVNVSAKNFKIHNDAN